MTECNEGYAYIRRFIDSMACIRIANNDKTRFVRKPGINRGSIESAKKLGKLVDIPLDVLFISNGENVLKFLLPSPSIVLM